jgi:hypothetical protein
VDVAALQHGNVYDMYRDYDAWFRLIDLSLADPDTSGDGTVSQQSGDGPRGKVRRIFRTTGYDHQGSYANKHMLSLTHHLICKIVQEAK